MRDQFRPENCATGVENRIGGRQIVSPPFREQVRKKRDQIQISCCAKSAPGSRPEIENQAEYCDGKCEERQLDLIGQKIGCSTDAHITFVNVTEEIERDEVVPQLPNYVWQKDD